MSTNSELVRDAVSTARTRADTWTTLPEDERRLRAIAACRDHDGDALWQVAEAYFSMHGRAGAAPNVYTLRNYRHGIASLLEAWCSQDLLRPRRDAAQAWLDRMDATGLTSSTVAVRLAAARTLYKALRWVGATDIDPFLDLRPIPTRTDTTEPDDERRPYSLTEIEALRRAAALIDEVLILLAGHAGLRAGEIMELRWDDIDLAGRSLTVRHVTSHKQRRVVLSRSTVDALVALQNGENGENGAGYVLPYRTQHEARARMRRLCKRARVPYHGLHNLRHAAGARLVAQTGSLELAAGMLGHSSLDTTRVYAKWSDDSLRAALGEW